MRRASLCCVGVYTCVFGSVCTHVYGHVFGYAQTCVCVWGVHVISVCLCAHVQACMCLGVCAHTSAHAAVWGVRSVVVHTWVLGPRSQVTHVHEDPSPTGGPVPSRLATCPPPSSNSPKQAAASLANPASCRPSPSGPWPTFPSERQGGVAGVPFPQPRVLQSLVT